MSDYDVGYCKPPKHTQFGAGQRINKNGRPRKPPRVLLSVQERKDFLKEIDSLVEVHTSKGIEKITKDELITRNIVNGAAKLKPTALKIYERRKEAALASRKEAYAPVRLTELLLEIFDDPQRAPTKEEIETLDGMIKYIKLMY